MDNEIVLLQRLQSGDVAAVKEIFVRHRKWLMVVAMAECIDEEQAKRMIDDLFFKEFLEQEIRASVSLPLANFLYSMIRERCKLFRLHNNRP